MIPVVTVAEMRAIDEEAHATVDHAVLVDRAGTAVAAAGLRLLGGAYGRRVVVVAGKGSNGADGRVAADRLRRRGARVKVVEAADAPDRIARDGDVDLVIDAAYGTGFRGTYRAPSVPAGVPVLAVDVPSGVDGDTGAACGEPLRADVTVTFAALKPGLLQGDGPLLAGRVEVVDIGLDVDRARLWVVEDADVARLLPVRGRGAYKWQSAVAVVAGSPGMTGAAELCAHAAYRAGAGMVRLGVPGADPALLTAGEAVAIELAADGWAATALDMVTRCHSLVVGPGLGRAEGTADQVRTLVARSPVPVVVDADGLVALGSGDEIAPVVAGPGGRSDHGRRPPRRSHPPRRRVRLPDRRPPRSRPHRGGPDPGPPHRCRRAVEGTHHRGGRTRRYRSPGHRRIAPPGHRRHRRRALGGHRRLRGPRPPGSSKRPAWPPTSTAGPPPSVPPRDWSPGTWPTCSVAGSRTSAVGETGPRSPGLRPTWAEIDLAAVRHNAALLGRLAAPAALCAVVKADAYGHGSVPVARRRPRGRGRLAGRGPGRRGGDPAARRHRRPRPGAVRTHPRGHGRRRGPRPHPHRLHTARRGGRRPGRHRRRASFSAST